MTVFSEATLCRGYESSSEFDKLGDLRSDILSERLPQQVPVFQKRGIPGVKKDTRREPLSQICELFPEEKDSSALLQNLCNSAHLLGANPYQRTNWTLPLIPPTTQAQPPCVSPDPAALHQPRGPIGVAREAPEPIRGLSVVSLKFVCKVERRISGFGRRSCAR